MSEDELKDGDKVYVAGEIFVWNPTQPHVDFKCYGLANGVSVNAETVIPASAVPTEEQRAAVGRLVEFAEQRFAAVTGEDHWRDLEKSWHATTPADIEAARAVAEGGADGR